MELARSIVGRGGHMGRLGRMHAHQAAEKTLKGTLIAVDGKFPRMHNIEILVKACAEVAPEIAELATPLTGLSIYYLQLRYPSPGLPITQQEAAALVDQATELLACARRVTGV